MNIKLLIVVNVDWFFLSHRLPIALEAQKKGFDVTIVTADTGKVEEIRSHGLTVETFPFQRSGTNAIKELSGIFQLARLYKKHSPGVIHHVTLKTSIFGSIAARVARVPGVINAISGLGFAFSSGKKNLLNRIIQGMMKVAFRGERNHFIFQNPDDFNLFKEAGYGTEDNSMIIKGSGIDLQEYSYETPTEKEKLQIVLPGRMLKDKGVMEFIEAAKLMKEQLYGKCEWLLVGDVDEENPSTITKAELAELTDGDYIQWLGFQDGMKEIYQNSDIVVLPSYREGLPKALIEACAIGRPIVTTDAVGCRECVIEGENGYMVPVGDHEELARKVALLGNDRELRLEFGKKSRKLAENEFSIENVVEKHMEMYEKVLGIEQD